jgi:hypothetical protein
LRLHFYFDLVRSGGRSIPGRLRVAEFRFTKFAASFFGELDEVRKNQLCQQTHSQKSSATKRGFFIN